MTQYHTTGVKEQILALYPGWKNLRNTIKNEKASFRKVYMARNYFYKVHIQAKF